jgi:hypothetical protein
MPDDEEDSGVNVRREGMTAGANIGDLVPRPDPTVLTTAIVNQAKGDLRRESGSLREIIDTRINGTDAQLQLILELVRSLPFTTAHALEQQGGLFDVKLAGLRELTSGRFDEIAQQFAVVERQRLEQKVDTKSAVDAAFAAAEKSQTAITAASERAIAKSEQSTKEQLTSLGDQFQTSVSALQKAVDDQKERSNALELRMTSRLDTAGGTATGEQGSKLDARAEAQLLLQQEAVLTSKRQVSMAIIAASVSSVIAVISIVVAVLVAVS